MILIWGRQFYHEKQPHARNFFNYFFRNLAMFVYFYDRIIGMNRIFKKRLTIKTRYNPELVDDRKAFKNACNILREQGVEFEISEETVATEFGKKLYFRYSLTTDFIIWIILPLIALITLIF